MTIAGIVGGCEPVPSPVVATESGQVRGAHNVAAGTVAYLGIPYARVAERFSPPADATAWTGIRDAFDYGPACPQTHETEVAQDEDCLGLNVWAPSEPGPHPVMVWIHGGGYVQGSASASINNGANLAATGDVVVVGINYRLGALGFLATPDDDGIVGNAGLRDQVRALQWVQDNIAGFGGNPYDVTIFGESAGGASVCALLGVPEADDLFDRAIVQSGACNNMLAPDEPALGGPSIHERHGWVIEDVGCADAPDVAACVREPARLDALLQAASPPILPFPSHDESRLMGPIIDDDLTVANGQARLASGGRPDLPMIVGFTDQETTGLALIHGVWTQLQYDEEASALFGPELGPQLVSLYPAAAFRGVGPAFDTMVTEVGFKCPAWSMANTAAAGPHPVYVYNFAYGDLALHGLDVPFVFGNGNLIGDGQVSDAMMLAWTNFARTSVPAGAQWPAYAPGAVAVMTADEPIFVDDQIAEGRCAQLQALGVVD